MNIYDYIINNNEELKEINVVDAIIFTRLSYLHLEDIIIKLPMKISDISKYTKNIKISRNDKKLINLLKESNRYKNIIIKRCKYIEDIDNVLVFKATTISLPNNNLFISFRGTGKNFYDFKEDMNMSYKEVPSCIEGIKYIEEEKKYNKLYVSGHSKGGHVAMYASSHTKYFTRRKIKKVYNFDGPGFLKIDKELKDMKGKIVNYFPESSIVGRIMNSVGEIIPIKTIRQGIEAHIIYNWEVKDNNLVVGKLTHNSDLFHEECLNILKVISSKRREIIINYFFTLILKGEIKSIKELDLIKVREIINNTPKITKEEKTELMKFFKILIKCSMPEIPSKEKIIKRIKPNAKNELSHKRKLTIVKR